jgi:hypothetical protein
MHADYDPIVILPRDLSEAAAALLKLLQEITRVPENHYAAQLRRYDQPRDDPQQPPWADQDPPF